MMAELGRRKDAVKRHRAELRNARERKQLYDKAAEVAKVVIDELVKDGSVAEMQSMLTEAVQASFSGRDFSIEIDVNDRGKDKTADLWLVDSTEGGEPKRTLLYEGNGGGLASVTSMIMLVYMIMYFDRERFLYADEPMSELSIEFVPGFIEFLELITSELGFKVLMNTHDTRFEGYADRKYFVTRGDYRRVK